MRKTLLNGERIKERLDELNWSQDTLAKKSKISLRQIQRILNGNPTSPAARDDLAAALGVTGEEITLFGGAPVALGSIPHKNPQLFGRDPILRDLIRRLRAFSVGDLGSGENVLCIHGTPGVGKTSLVVALIYEYNVEIKKYFPDSEYWRTLGKEPDPLTILQSWCQGLGVPQLLDPFFARVGKEALPAIEEQAGARFRAFLLQNNKRCLFILDDAWFPAHVSPLLVAGGKCATIITTRRLSISERFASPGSDIPLSRLGVDDSLKLLEHRAGKDILSEHLDACRELLKRLDGLPLAIVVAAGMLRRATSRGLSVDEVILDLNHRTEKLLHQTVPREVEQFMQDGATPSVVALLQMSTDELDEETFRCFAIVGNAVTPSEEATFDLKRMARAWGFRNDPEKARVVADRLIEDGLLELAGALPTEPRYYMHDLLIQHAKTCVRRKEG